MKRKCPKRGWPTRLDAEIALARRHARDATHRRNREDRRAEVRPYFHRQCGRWHLTSMGAA